MEVTGNKAYTVLKALCTYKDASKEDNSAHEYSYAIELEKINDKWMINKAISNNPWDKKFTLYRNILRDHCYQMMNL